jgi:hypothetical protein
MNVEHCLDSKEFSISREYIIVSENIASRSSQKRGPRGKLRIYGCINMKHNDATQVSC